jgi:hypothetical protein
MIDRHVAAQLKALAEDYERRAEKVARGDAVEASARLLALNVSASWGSGSCKPGSRRGYRLASECGAILIASSGIARCGALASSNVARIHGCGLRAAASIRKERVVLIRSFALALIVAAVVLPCSARTILKSEPLILAPYQITFVQDASCRAGEVLKVTGAIRGLDRKKVCVARTRERTSLATAGP